MVRVQRITPAMSPEPGEVERSETETGGGDIAGGARNGRAHESVPVPDAEVTAKARRRTFTAQYKLEILDAVEAARESGQIGALLRREGLFSSHLTKWNAQRRAGALTGLAPRRRGPKAEPPNPLAKRNAELERENRRLHGRLAQAEAICEIQKKVSALLGIPLGRPENDGRNS
jgi:transposase